MVCSASHLFLVLIFLYRVVFLICFMSWVICIPVIAILFLRMLFLLEVFSFLFYLVSYTTFFISSSSVLSLCIVVFLQFHISKSWLLRSNSYTFLEIILCSLVCSSRFPHSLGNCVLMFSCIFPLLCLPFLLFLLFCFPLPIVFFDFLLLLLYTYLAFAFLSFCSFVL